jgi:uncharacterized integral membrane protein
VLCPCSLEARSDVTHRRYVGAAHGWRADRVRFAPTDSRYSREINDRGQIEGLPRKEGRGWKFYVVVAALVLLAIFVIQNSQSVPVEFLFTTIDTPLFFALIVAGALGAVIGWAAPRVRRGGYRDEP